MLGTPVASSELSERGRNPTQKVCVSSSKPDGASNDLELVTSTVYRKVNDSNPGEHDLLFMFCSLLVSHLSLSVSLRRTSLV